MSTELIIFSVLAVVVLASAYKVVTARLITHAALFLVLSFTGVAGIYLQMHQEFLAAIQVLVYVGAITTMILFAIMLSEIRDIKMEVETRRTGLRYVVRRSAPFAFVVGAVFAAFMTYLFGVAGWDQPVGAALPYQVQAVGKELFTTFVVPFEVASILLLAAMIGAIVLTAREEADR